MIPHPKIIKYIAFAMVNLYGNISHFHPPILILLSIAASSTIYQKQSFGHLIVLTNDSIVWADNGNTNNIIIF